MRLAAPALLGFDPQSRDLGESRLGNCGRIVLRAVTSTEWVLEAWLGDVPGGLPASHDATG